MAEAKTRPTAVKPQDFIAGVENETRRKDAEVLLKLMERATGWKAQMWGPSIIGFGKYEYAADSGRSGVWPVVGFSPRKANMVVYVMPGFSNYSAQLKKLGKHKTGASCLYLGPLSGIDMSVLEVMVKDSVAAMKKKYKVSAT